MSRFPATADQIFLIRLLIADTATPPKQVFSDDEISGFCFLAGNVWQSGMFFSGAAGQMTFGSIPSDAYRAAALALNTLANNAARLLMISQLLDVKLTTSAAACQALREGAQALLDMDDNSGAFAIAEQVTTQWSFGDRWLKQIQRQSGGQYIG